MQKYVGIEIFNDDTTPMELVVALFESAFCLDANKAITRIISIHKNGSALVVIFDEEYESAIMKRFTKLNDASPNPLRFAVAADVAFKKVLYVDPKAILSTEPKKFPPEKKAPMALIFIALSICAGVYFALWRW